MRNRYDTHERSALDRFEAAITLFAIGCMAFGALAAVAVLHVAGWGSVRGCP
jgi:hypothetical protein